MSTNTPDRQPPQVHIRTVFVWDCPCGEVIPLDPSELSELSSEELDSVVGVEVSDGYSVDGETAYQLPDHVTCPSCDSTFRLGAEDDDILSEEGMDTFMEDLFDLQEEDFYN